MRVFVYKLIITCVGLFILFQLTFGYLLRSVENKIMNTFSKDKINLIKNKIREEIKDSLKKDKIFSKEDDEILKKFIKKINDEIN